MNWLESSAVGLWICWGGPDPLVSFCCPGLTIVVITCPLFLDQLLACNTGAMSGWINDRMCHQTLFSLFCHSNLLTRLQLSSQARRGSFYVLTTFTNLFIQIFYHHIKVGTLRKGSGSRPSPLPCDFLNELNESISRFIHVVPPVISLIALGLE